MSENIELDAVTQRVSLQPGRRDMWTGGPQWVLKVDRGGAGADG